mgnify:CR=1 FL=1
MTKMVFGEWLPDQPALDNPGATIAKNVLPYVRTYGSFKSLQSFSNALHNVCVGSATVKDSAGIIHVHAGSETKLEELSATKTWSDISKSGGYVGAASWRWARFGDRLIAVAPGIAPQFYDLTTSTTYLDLPGTPPKAECIATIRNFLVLGNLNDGTARPNRLNWSGYNNTELWTPSIATQSDTRDLEGDGGDIQAIVPGQYGVVFQENSIWTMTYSGPPTIFRLNEVEEGRGTPAPDSVCWSGSTIYFLGQDGFYAFNGQSSRPIGAEKIDRWFFETADENSVRFVRGVVDRRNRMVIWSFRSSSTLNHNDFLLIYNWAADKWSYCEVDTEVISEYLTTDFTLDQLDTPLPNGIDLDSIPVDSEAFRGGRVSMAAFDTSHRMGTFNGASLNAELETKEIADPSGNTLVLTGVRPLVDGAGATITVQSATRTNQNENYSYGLAQAQNTLGKMSFRNKARYHRIRVNTTGEFSDAFGVDIDVQLGGKR